MFKLDKDEGKEGVGLHKRRLSFLNNIYVGFILYCCVKKFSLKGVTAVGLHK